MGYRKIVQYGNVVEIYDYEKDLKKKGGVDALRAYRLMHPKERNTKNTSPTLAKKRQDQIRIQSKAKGVYTRSKRSVKRSKDNFFRLCHHNNCLAQSIHFITLTFAYDLTYKKASRYVSEFFRRVQTTFPEISLSYISVPELTKKGRLHFHLLVYGLPPETAERERETRNFQRQFRRGYVDISLATYTSEGIAGYMAKYMAKAIADTKVETTRGYNCSRNIDRFTSAGSNNLSQYEDLIIPTEDIVDIEERQYDVPYLGTCRFTKLTKKL